MISIYSEVLGQSFSFREKNCHDRESMISHFCTPQYWYAIEIIYISLVNTIQDWLLRQLITSNNSFDNMNMWLFKAVNAKK